MFQKESYPMQTSHYTRPLRLIEEDHIQYQAIPGLIFAIAQLSCLYSKCLHSFDNSGVCSGLHDRPIPLIYNSLTRRKFSTNITESPEFKYLEFMTCRSQNETEFKKVI